MFKFLKRYKYSLFILVAWASFLIYFWSFIFSYDAIFEKYNPLLFSDVARLDPTLVMAVDVVNTTEQIQNIVKDAQKKWLKISLAGSKHSQWWHTYYKDNVVIDMRGYNKILKLDTEKKHLTVQAGSKWSDVQEFLNTKGLAVKIMQSSNLFTIGGTMSANAHWRDTDDTTFIESVDSFRLLTSSGEILDISRTHFPELFRSVIGGYGLFGIILDVTLQVTDNAVYSQEADIIKLWDLESYFEKNIRNNPSVAMMLARPSIASDSFFEELVVSKWMFYTGNIDPKIYTLTKEQNVWRDKLFFGLSRKYGWAKDLRWYLQKKVELAVGDMRIMTRNNSMRPPLAPLEFLEYYSKDDTDIIQEYYIPISKYKSFIGDFRKILVDEKVNVISFTIRYVKKNNETLLPYCSKEDCFAIIYMANVWLDASSQSHIESTTQKLVDSVITHSGVYYLTYQLYPTSSQIRSMYPRFEEFIQQKKKYDTEELFINKFYKKYENN
jgi:decaprenylphospho-beta-D-ribofuranose 2-oxidase